MKHPGRDTDPPPPPPPPPRRAERAGAVRLGTGAGIPEEAIREAVRRDNVLDLETPMPIPKYDSSANRERARVSVTEETRVERGESRRPASSISGAISVLTKATTWTPGHLAISLAFLLWVVTYLLGGREGIQALLDSSRDTKQSLTLLIAQQEAMNKTLLEIQAQNVKQSQQIRLVGGFASALNYGKPNALWDIEGHFDGPPAGQEHRAPRFTTQAELVP